MSARIIAALAAIGVMSATAASASALTPSSGQLLPNRPVVEGLCDLTEGVPDGRLREWLIATIDPKRVHGGPNGGVTLAPASLPRIEEMAKDVVNDFSAVPVPQAIARPNKGGGCSVEAIGPDTQLLGTSVVLARPGPYVFMQADSRNHWTATSNPDPPPPTRCAENDNGYNFAPEGPAPPPEESAPAGTRWIEDWYCDKVTVVPFFVQGDTGGCPMSGDMSAWPATPYINQYDAGARLVLPVRFGDAGGNGCGPSSLLMALLARGAPVSPTLLEAFDNTMGIPSSIVRSNAANAFQGYRAVGYLESLGYRQARVLPLGTSAAAANSTNLATLFQEIASAPVVVSTAFGTGRWGKSGGGHMIAVTGFNLNGFEVSDPAGNYFSGPTDHYGDGKCGYSVTYPIAWMKAYIVGRWILRIGRHTALPAQQPRRSLRAVTPTLGTSIAVVDAHPGTADDPTSFYLQDPGGRRAGWIDGVPVEEIPDAYVGQEPVGWTETANGDPDVDPDPGAPPAQPRALVVPSPQPGTVLHVVAASGVPFALSATTWRDGAIVGNDEVSGTGSGQDAIVPSGALDEITSVAPPVMPVVPALPVPTSAPAPKLVTPAVSRLTIAPRAFAAAAKGPSTRSGTRPSGTGARVAFRLNIPARVRFTLERRVAGRRVAGRCQASTGRNRRARPCVRYVRAPGAFKRNAPAGASAFVFTGRVAGRALRPGAYRLVAVPSASTATGIAARAPFSVRRRSDRGFRTQVLG